jgi:hypothetical protein
METKHRFKVGNFGTVPAGGQIKVPSINDKPISGLVKALNEKGVEIVPSLSQKTISYMVGNKSRSAIIPLEDGLRRVAFGDTKYCLKGPGFQLTLRNYRDSHSLSPKEVIGGSVHMQGGIRCSATSTNGSGEEIIETAQAVVEAYYSGFPLDHLEG